MGALPTPASEVANVAVKRTPSHLNFILLPNPTEQKPHYYFPPTFTYYNLLYHRPVSFFFVPSPTKPVLPPQIKTNPK